MTTVGERLRSERERRGLQRVDVSRATRVYIHHLSALEHGSFDELPDDAVVRGYVRSYAEYLGLDPEATVAEFLRERGISGAPAADAIVDSSEPVPKRIEHDAAPKEPVGARSSEAEADSAAETPRRPFVFDEPSAEGLMGPVSLLPAASSPGRGGALRMGRLFPLVAVALAAVALVWWGTRGSSEPVPDRSAEERPVDTTAPGEPAAAAEAASTRQRAPAGETPQAPPAGAPDAPPEAVTPGTPAPSPAPATASRLSVTEYGVGTGVVENRLVGESDRFPPGRKVWFWTRVRGGAPGDIIRHVWLHEGSVVETIKLRIGASHWRTHSFKTPYAEGDWAVEVRDAAGNVLARAAFTCER